MELFFVYIMTNKPNGTIYIGSTKNLNKRVWEHKNDVVPCFTSRYKLHSLVYYEAYHSYTDAAKREKCLKNWLRKWKIKLIETCNPSWRDISNEL